MVGKASRERVERYTQTDRGRQVVGKASRDRGKRGIHTDRPLRQTGIRS